MPLQLHKLDVAIATHLNPEGVLKRWLSSIRAFSAEETGLSNFGVEPAFIISRVDIIVWLTSIS
jgi:hypothetical protein